MDEILQKLTLLYSKGLLDVGSEPEVHTDGVSNLVGIDLQLTREKMRELFRALEEKKRVVELLDRFLEKAAGEVMVQVAVVLMVESIPPPTATNVLLPNATACQPMLAIPVAGDVRFV